MRAVVTDAKERKTLAVVRALGREGVSLAVGGQRRWDQSLYSKYCRERFQYPNPQKDPDAFAAFLLEHVKGGDYDCILPASDYTTIAISRRKNDFQRYAATPVGDYDVLAIARDKAATLRVAQELGIGVPVTYYPESADELPEIAAKITYPCVVKLRKGTGAIGLWYADSPEELLSGYHISDRPSDSVLDFELPMIQEYVPGAVHDVCVLFNRGEPRAVLTQVRAKMYPATGGRGTVDVTTDDRNLAQEAVRLLRKIAWHGLAQVEFKLDSRDGRWKLMEINSRIWGGIDLSCRAGMNFPHLACKMAVEGDIAPQLKYKVGLKFRWLKLEWESAVGSAKPFSAALDVLRFQRGSKYDLVPSDPVPHLLNTGLAVYRPVRRLLGKGIPRRGDFAPSL